MRRWDWRASALAAGLIAAVSAFATGLVYYPIQTIVTVTAIWIIGVGFAE